MCVVTRTVGEPDGLVRFVRGPEGTVVPDIRCELPGRGVWVGARQALVGEAVRRKLFRRGLGEDVRAPEDLSEQVAELLRRQALSYLSLANKAGLVVAGFEKVAGAVEKGRAAVLIEATDGAEDGRRKLRDRLKASGREADPVTVFDSAALGLALGRPRAIHAALAEHGLARKFLAAARKFENYRSQSG